MANYRTAQGKMVDMSALAAKNEHVRAVGNMPVNARGDTIDEQGRVIVPVTQKVGEKYQRSVGNRNAQAKRTVVTPAKKPPQEELTQEEVELESSTDEEDIEIEKIKAQEKKK